MFRLAFRICYGDRFAVNVGSAGNIRALIFLPVVVLLGYCEKWTINGGKTTA
jgi:hypothetical protein